MSESNEREFPPFRVVVTIPVAVLATLLVGGCMVGVGLASPALGAGLGLVAAAAAAPIVWRLLTCGVRHLQVARALERDSAPGRLGAIMLRWRPSGSGSGAVVAGLRAPAIYCDSELRRSLSSGELTAVVLHERHHQLRRDPLRLLVLAALDPLVALVPEGRRWLEVRRARLEVGADLFALRHGADRADLARAILKLGAAGATTAPTATASFAAAVELRLRALVQDAHDLDDIGGPATLGFVQEHTRRAGLSRPVVATAGLLATCGLALAQHLLMFISG